MHYFSWLLDLFPVFLLGGLFGGGQPKQSAEEKALAKSQKEAVDVGVGGAKEDIPAARKALQDPLKFFQALLTGDRNTVMDVLGPEIKTLTAQYETAARSTEEFAPRGGGRTAVLEELPSKKAGDIATMVGGARREGAAG